MRREGGSTAAGAVRRDTLSQVLLLALVCSQQAMSQLTDSTAPRLVSMSAIDTRADVWQFASAARCTPTSCGAGVYCRSTDCTSMARVRVIVQDLPVAAGGQEPAGIKAVSVRFASPTAQRQGIEANYDFDEGIDRSLFSVGRLDFMPDMRVGSQTEGTVLEMPVSFDGYAETGDWRLDSIALTDHMDNREVHNRDFLVQSGYDYSISVQTLELSTCSGMCGGATVKCRQFGSPTADASLSPQHRVWWRCTSSGAAAAQQGACCTTCSEAFATASSIAATCHVPEALRFAPCGCAEEGEGQGWVCTSSYPGSSLGAPATCGGISGPWCHPNATQTVADSCGANGEGRLTYTASPSSGPSSPGSGGGGLAGWQGPASGGSIQGSSAGSNSSISNSTAGMGAAGGGGEKEKDGAGSAAAEGESDWWGVEVRQEDPASILIGLACMMGFFGGFLCIYFENRLRAVFRTPAGRPETQNASTSMASVHQPEVGGWMEGATDEEAGGDTVAETSEVATRARARALLAEEFGVGLGGGRGRPSAAARGGGRVSRAEAMARLREMGFGPLDASQALAAAGTTDVAQAADWILSRSWTLSRSRDNLPDTLPTVGWRGGLAAGAAGADFRQEARSWAAGDTFVGEAALTTTVMSAAEARQHGRQIRRTGSLPSAILSSGAGAGIGQGGMQGGGWGSIRSMVRDGSVARGGGRSRSGIGAPSGPAPSALPRRSQSVKLPGACDEGNECCVCMDAPIQTRLVPCAHDCLCRSCAQVIVDNCDTCPLCRSVIRGFILQ